MAGQGAAAAAATKQEQHHTTHAAAANDHDHQWLGQSIAMMKLLSCPCPPLPRLAQNVLCHKIVGSLLSVLLCLLLLLQLLFLLFFGCFLHGGQHVSRGLFWPLPYIFRVVTGTYVALPLSLSPSTLFLSLSLPFLLSLSHKANNRVVNHFLISGLRR